VDHFLVGAQTDEAEVSRKESTIELEKLDYSLGHQLDRCTTSRILVPVPGLRSRTAEEQHLESQKPRTTRVVSCECAICLNAYAPEDTIVWSTNANCPHVFHLHCMKRWTTKKTNEEVSCPCCRQVFLDHEEDDDRKEIKAAGEMYRYGEDRV
jgi:hypothetical protein